MDRINDESAQGNGTPTPAPTRKVWQAPQVTDLPRLTDLTLLTGNPIGGWGDTGGTGSTVF